MVLDGKGSGWNKISEPMLGVGWAIFMERRDWRSLMFTYWKSELYVERVRP
jgi:hypothetical protein